MRQAEREAAAQWQHGQSRKLYRSRWVIDVMRKALPPDHVALAGRLADRQATAEGLMPPGYERVDRSRNGAEGGAIAKLDAQRELAGFEAAVRSRLNGAGARCFWAIVEGRSLAETLRTCGYAQGSDRQGKQLIQLTMIAAAEYDDFCRAERDRHGSQTILGQCA